MADPELKAMMEKYVKEPHPSASLLDEIENRMESIDDPNDKNEAAKEFAHKIDKHGGEEHHQSILGKVAGTVVSGAMQAVVAHLVAKKLDKKGEAPSWKDDLIGGLAGGATTGFGPELLEKIKDTVMGK